VSNLPAKTVSEKKKKGLFRSTVGGTAKAGGTAAKGMAKVAGESTKIAAKGTYAVGKTTTKATYVSGKVAAKGGYITMKTGGRTFLFAARKAYPQHPDETKWQYRRRMAKLGFKVSMFTGKIVMAANGSATVEDFAKRIAADFASGAAQSLALEAVKQSVSIEKKSQRPKGKQTQLNHRAEVVTREIPPLPPGLNVIGTPPAIPPGLNVPGAPPAIPPGLNVPGAPPAIPPGLNVPGAPPSIPPGLNVPGAPPAIPPGLIKGPPSD
jgi:hypothetical protein